MKYLIAGGAGFIGTNLVRRLIEKEQEVLVLDDYSTGSPVNLPTHPKLKVWEYKIQDIDKLFRGTFDDVDRIINLACPASPVAYQEQPLHTLDTSFNGTTKLLEVASYTGARFLHTSTSEIYGDPKEHPQTEEYWGNVNCYGPRACYDEGKRVAESLIYEYQQVPVDARIVRIFNTYGPYMAMDDGRVVSNFIVQALRRQPITIYGDGSQTRSFCYVDDLLDGLLHVLEGDYSRPINLGNPSEFTIRELATVVCEVVGVPDSLIEYKPLPQDDPKQRRPDISKMKELYGWEPRYTLRQGIQKTVRYFETCVPQLPKLQSEGG